MNTIDLLSRVIVFRGFFPKGGGEVVFDVEPVQSIKPVDMTESGQLSAVRGISYVSGSLPKRVCIHTTNVKWNY